MKKESWIKNGSIIIYECVVNGIYFSATATTLKKAKEKIAKRIK